MRLIDSSMRVPPRSLTPQESASVAASRPIFTHEAWTLVTVSPSASRKTAVCLRFSSRLISSTPWARPSIVWNGMNESGTNSVKPPVRSCSSRTIRMCSASSWGSSMWPNMTVAVERIPARCEASMISTQRATGSLFGEIRSLTVDEHLGGGAGSRAEPGVAQPPEHLGGPEAAHVAHVRDLHRRVRVQVDVGRELLGEAQPPEVVLERPVGMDAGLDAELGRARLERLVHAPGELLARVLVGVG